MQRLTPLRFQVGRCYARGKLVGIVASPWLEGLSMTAVSNFDSDS